MSHSDCLVQKFDAKNGFQVKLKGAHVLPRLLFDRLVIINRINVVGRIIIIANN